MSCVPSAGWEVILNGVSEADGRDPGSPRNRERTKESWRQVRGLLMEWDLIGVAGVPEAADEYDCMIGRCWIACSRVRTLFRFSAGSGTSGWLILVQGLTMPKTCGSQNRSLPGGKADGRTRANPRAP
jgi:hypothetical protein